MCGICGIIQHNKNVEKRKITDMLGFLVERGPDNQSVYLDKKVGLGHSRLSIIDLDNRSNQPFISSQKNIIVYNGEIYNFKNIKIELEKEGILFHTTSDTEVVLEAYQYWGLESTLNKIDGMFAFCIYNPSSNELLLARDRLGKKPLYYYHSNESFYFSSDIRSIWSSNKTKLTIDWESIDYYFSELSVPQPKSIWNEINQLKPAHYARYNLENNEFSHHRYWKLPKESQLDLSKDETVKKTELLLQQAINKRMISDVPLGFFLSGGIDSGLIVALAAQANSEPIKTYTISVDDSKMDESKYAEKVAQRFGTDHHNIHVTYNLIENIVSLIKYNGEPFADSSLIPTFLITQAIKDNVSVAISGDGGDELFGGYKDYGLAFRTDIFNTKWGNSAIRKPIIWGDKIISRLTQRENYGSYNQYGEINNGNRLARQMSYNSIEKKKLYESVEISQSLGFTEKYWEEIWNNNKCDSLSENLMRSSLDTRLLNDYLVKIDRGSMINSVEVRSPFLDRELTEFAFSMNYKNKFTKDSDKIILRQLANKHLGSPSSVKPKTGFEIPIHNWLRNELKPWRNELINNFLDRKITSKKLVNELVNEFDENKNEHTFKIWSLICLELWFQHFYD
jgi:asparagine synthase (glutamine-hydrolysing)